MYILGKGCSSLRLCCLDCHSAYLFTTCTFKAFSPPPLVHSIHPLILLSRSWQTLHYTSYLSPIQKSTPVEVTTTTPTTISPYDPSKLALLVETRPLPHLPALFAHMSSIIPPEWTFLFLGSNISIPFLRTSPTIARLESTGRMRLDFIPSNYSLTSRETISQMFTDLHLYETILSPAEHLLVFQPDSIFCANAPTTLNDFLDWDWIGAPWSVDATHGGNGGLGLRKVSKILEVLKKEKRQDGDGQLEDLWLSERINHLKGARMPNATISKTFSVESVWDDRPLGYHVGWLGVHHPQVRSSFIVFSSFCVVDVKLKNPTD